MPQNFVSRYNNLLAVKGRGGIEYTAGPNIDISDYIISGRDWTSDIDSAIQGVKGSSFDATTAWVDSQGYLTEHQDVSNLPYVQNSALDPTLYGLFSGISGSGLYATSAENAFTAETANYALYSEEAGSAASAATAEYSMSATSAYSAQYAQSANSALGSQTALISMFALSSQSAGLVTEGWDYTDPENSAISGLISGYNGSAFYDLAGDINCPWISGNKVISPTQETYAGQEFQVISSFDFSGNKNHFISLKGMVLKFPSTAHIASALGDKFDTTSFNNFITNGFNPNMTELHGATAYLSAFVNTGCVHNSALDYTEDDKISGISGIPLIGGGGTAEVPWISGDKYIGPEVLLDFGDAVQYISSFTVSGDHNHAIALKGSQFKLPSTAHISAALEDRLPVSSFSSYTSYADGRMDSIFQLANSAYTTAVNNYYNKADKSAISSWSGDINYISGEFTAFTATATGLAIEYSAGDNIDITDHIVSGKDWLPTIESGLSSKLDTTAFTAFTATADFVNSGDVTGTAQWALTTGGWQKITAASGDYELSAGAGISIVDYPEDQKTVISVTAGGGGGAVYQAGQYIDINASNVISVTGLQPSGNYQTAGNYVSSTTFNNYTATADVAAYTAGPNIDITNHIVSGKDWTDTITAASAYAASQATGKEYSGIAPIVVNNTTDQISAQTMDLIAGAGIEFVTVATSTTINCTATGGGASVHYYIDTPNEHTSADIELTIQTSANIGGRYDRWLMNSGNFIGALIPSADTVNDAGKVLTVTAGSPRWQPLPATPSGALGIKVLAVATSAAATAGDADTLYIVTGS